MDTLGSRISKYRIKNKLSQSQLGDLLFVSDKTISSWENDRTVPDLDTLFKLANIFKTSFYQLSMNEYSNLDNLELEIKLKVDEYESKRILGLIKKDSIYLGEEKHSAIYYKPTLRDFDNEYLRIRKENNIYILNYKKNKDKSICEEYETIIDNADNMDTILKHLNLTKKGEINKVRQKYLYKNKYEFSFDTVKDIGIFVEIEVKNLTSYEEEYNNLFELLNEFKIDINNINNKRYIDYLEK